MKTLRFLMAALATSVLISTAAIAENETSGESSHAPKIGLPSIPYPMTQSINPMTYFNMMPMMVNPTETMTNPVSSCASCHDGEDVARYQKTMGPMLNMMNPNMWMNPNAYMQMMAMPMDPETYTEWFNAITKMMGNIAAPLTEK